jgi:hypothetical protein
MTFREGGMKNVRVLAALALFLSVTSNTSADDGLDIHQAARSGDVARVAALLDADPERVGALTAHHETPLHYAALGRSEAVVDLLLARGADAQAADSAGRTPMHIVAMQDDETIIAALRAGGAAVDALDGRGETPLHHAARHFNGRAIHALLAAGADASAESADRLTPLHVLGGAARVHDDAFEVLLHSLADLLIARGADSTIIADGFPALLPPPAPDPGQSRDTWTSYSDIGPDLLAYQAAYPAICQRYNLGASVQGRDLWAIRISDNIGIEDDEPEFKYIAAMHGDEIVGTKMCMNLIDYLLTNYGGDPQVNNIIDEIDLWIVPTMNPDGYVLGQRENANGVDLNRNFPEWMNGDPDLPAGHEIETQHIMNWSTQHSFVASANFHGGVVVVNYPFDNDGLGSTFSPTPDEDMFVYISEQYSIHNVPMWNGAWYHGITNGAAWYSIDGGMQDWNYRYKGCNEVTIELSNSDSPPASEIGAFWNDNRDAMLAYIETCLIGVRGIVTDVNTGAPLSATVTVVGRDHDIYTDPDLGDYHRMLLPGTYDVQFEAAGYDPVVISDVLVSSGNATVLNISMGPPPVITYPNGGETLNADVEVDVMWLGGPTTLFQVQYTSNYNDIQTIADGFETGTLGPEYTTGGDADWFVTGSDTHSGSYSARTGDIGDNGNSWMTRAAGGGPVSFWFRVSSEKDYDSFNFYVDGVRKIHTSGQGSWTPYSTTLAPGPHELKWEYDKDYSGSHYSDTVWVDDIEFVADNTTWTDIIALTSPGVLSTPWMPTDVSSDYKVRVRAFYGGSTYSDWDESDATFEVVEGAYQLGDLNCDTYVDFDDVPHFVQALVDPAGYDAAHGSCDRMLANMNGDAAVDGADVQLFVVELVGF